MRDLLLVGGGLILLACVVLAVMYPRLSLLTLVALDVSNINAVIADQVGISPYKPQLALAVVVVLVMVRRGMFRFRWSPVLLGTLVLFAGCCLSFVTAADPLTSQDVLMSLARDLLYFVVVYALMLSTDQIRSVASIAVLVLAALAGLTVVHEFVLNNSGSLFGLSRVPLVQEDGALTPRHAGTSSDVNFWARLLILFTPLSASLFAIGRSGRERLVWGCATLALLLGVYLTQSRGGFIALFVGLLVWAVLAGGVYRKSLLYLPFALIILVPLSGIGSRLGTLSAILSGSTTTADPSVVTRKRFQLDAWNMFADRPITGHGIGSYGVLFPTYDRVANYYEPVDIVVAAHNFYLEQAADGGVVLLACWVFFSGTVLFVALRTVIGARRTGDDASRFLALGVVGGLTGWMIASIFLHLSDFRALLLIAAIAAAVDARYRGRLDQTTREPAPDPAQRPRSRVLVTGLVTVAALGLVGIAVLAATERPAYSSTATLGVVSVDSTEPGSAYGLDVVSRGLIVPTLAEVLRQSIEADDLVAPTGRNSDGSDGVTGVDATVTVAQSRLGGAIDITVTAATESLATDLGRAAAALAKAKVAELNMGYQLIGDPVAATPLPPYPWWLLPALALMVAACTTLAAILGRRRSTEGTRWVRPLRHSLDRADSRPIG
jgi:O-antigen ligase